MKFEELKNINEIDEWMNIARKAGLNSFESVKKEVEKSIKFDNINIGKAFSLKNEFNKIIGTSYIKEVQDYDTISSITIFHIAIKKDFRKQGLGKELLRNTFIQAKKLNKKFACLFTTTAENFYLSCGMKKFGEFPNFVLFSDGSRMSRKYLYIDLENLN